jgi:hypothetical protein
VKYQKQYIGSKDIQHIDYFMNFRGSNNTSMEKNDSGEAIYGHAATSFAQLEVQRMK